MKTRNIRWMTLLLAVAMTVGASAQKNVLKAFDKMERAKEVVVKKVNNKTNDTRVPERWRCNVQEFHISKAEAARKHIARIDDAFSKDSKKDNVTYYIRMYALGEKPTDKEKDAYKKIIIKCDNASEEVVIGSDPSYHVIAMCFQSVTSAALRSVMALEWKQEPGYGYSVRTYEIEGQIVSLKEEPFFNWNTRHWRPAKTESSKDDVTTRMHFYRDTFDGEDNSENSALLLNMTEYLNTNWSKMSEVEQKMVIAILQEMSNRSKSKMHRDLIGQYGNTLKNGKGGNSDVIKRLELYVMDFHKSKVYNQQFKILESMRNYAKKLSKEGIDEKTINEAYELLIQFKYSVKVYNQQVMISDIISILEK